MSTTTTNQPLRIVRCTISAPPEMNKAEEIELYGRIVDALPKGGYLRPMLADMANHVHNQIANDFAFIDWQTRTAEQRQHREAVAALEQKRDELTQQIAKLGRELSRQRDALEQEIDRLRTDARIIAEGLAAATKRLTTR